MTPDEVLQVLEGCASEHLWAQFRQEINESASSLRTMLQQVESWADQRWQPRTETEESGDSNSMPAFEVLRRAAFDDDDDPPAREESVTLREVAAYLLGGVSESERRRVEAELANPDSEVHRAMQRLLRGVR